MTIAVVKVIATLVAMTLTATSMLLLFSGRMEHVWALLTWSSVIMLAITTHSLRHLSKEALKLVRLAELQGKLIDAQNEALVAMAHQLDNLRSVSRN